MTAKEMFEKIRYEQVENNKYYIAYHSYVFNDEHITFDLRAKTFYGYRDDYPLDVDYDMLQAINKQVEELGWN